ncbi:aminomethyltransferase [Rhizobium sp. Root274]|uniref:CAF17-like 4Fe-4S cluster assembly/insertion protein YgfZ n=1 Tax=unclassified Rhizobium TaxID=2613769 RepID=UPI0007125820|nr:MULTISPECIES: folate-binding protein YgfZ [unclassified Rhizobium]KQW31041.1 aminomethyltransferase [Rhizobium sp. Root1240]KRD32589.1 aminomethyltransferase [Rhizobium sp. Root274]
MPSAFLPDRAFVQVGGPDAEHFLQNLITTDLGSLAEGEARPGALLTPQGKIQFDFLIWRRSDGFVLDTTVDQQEALTRRLTMYKLRAAVTLAAGSETGATVTWGGEDESGILDHRFALAGTPVRRTVGKVGEPGEASAYAALRILNGVVESGADYALQDAFPHDILFDKSGGVSFRKGCYVGQEVVSRMQHRSTARRRAVIVSADRPLPGPGTEITIEDKVIGTLGTVAGSRGLAILRIDKAGEAMARGTAILAGEVPLSLALPAWSGLTFPSDAAEDA